MYQRNYLYIESLEQLQMSKIKILFAGAGIGSNIAECALRLGYTNLHIIDNDTIQKSNLNRQNYTYSNIGGNKSECLHKRLIDINPEAKIKYDILYLDSNNIRRVIEECKPDIAINALDFTSDAPFIFDKICQLKNIPIIHPFNLGWAGLVTVVDNINFQIIQKNYNNFEIAFVEFITNKLRENSCIQLWLDEILNKAKIGLIHESYPQLSVGSWFVAAMTTKIIHNIATNKPIKTFPDFYFKTLD